MFPRSLRQIKLPLKVLDSIRAMQGAKTDDNTSDEWVHLGGNAKINLKANHKCHDFILESGESMSIFKSNSGKED